MAFLLKLIYTGDSIRTLGNGDESAFFYGNKEEIYIFI